MKSTDTTVTPEEFRSALGHFASSVTVVTARCEDEKLRGITVSAFSSLSLDPPLILICIDTRASLHEYLKEGCYFAVNILAEDQELVSRRFASKDPERFNGVGYKEGIERTPLLDGALANIECRVTSAYPGGDHTIFVGEVVSTHIIEHKPLLYFRGGYRQLE